MTFNPRFVIWAESRGLSPAELMRPDRDEVVNIDNTPWTVLFMSWISDRWYEWARELGYRDAVTALADGHTHEDFDAWLEARR